MSISSEEASGSESTPTFFASGTGISVVALIGVTLVGGAVVIYNLYSGRFTSNSELISPIVSLTVAALFSAAPLLACFAHTISIGRQKKKLQGLVIQRLMKTQYFRLALASLNSVRPASVRQPDFLIPMLLFATIIIFCSLTSFMSLFWMDIFTQKSAILGGLHVIGDENLDDVRSYQSGTLVVAAVAFVGAYLALFNRLLNQINNNDIYPISFHYFSVWLITAMVLAAVMRHFAIVFGITENAALLAVAFAIGAMPAPFFAAFIHWALGQLRITGDKDDPNRNDMPSNLNLLMIDGLANEKIDRLAELGVSDAQVLSCQNPFLLWVRLPYDLALIVDWIAQAQLYVCLREEGFRKARAQQIGDIHKFVSVLSDPQATNDLCSDLGLKPSYVAPLVASLNESPCFVRLREVKRAMLPDPATQAAANVSATGTTAAHQGPSPSAASPANLAELPAAGSS